MEREAVKVTLLAIVPQVSIVVHANDNDVIVCEGELQILETSFGLVIFNVAPHFQYALRKTFNTLKTLEGRYILPHTSPDSEYHITVLASEADSLAVLEYCLKENTIFTVQKKNLKSKLSGWVKKGGQAVSSGIKKGASWMARGLSALKKKKPVDEDEEHSAQVARQKIEHSRNDNTKMFVMPALAVAGLVAATNAIESQSNPDSLPEVAARSGGQIKSAVSESLGFMKSSLEQVANQSIVEQTGLNMQQVKSLISVGRSTMEVASKFVGPEEVKQLAGIAERFLRRP